MSIKTKQDILDVLAMPQDEFERTVMAEAKKIHQSANRDELVATAMLGFDNICKNQCLYCGMRAGNKNVDRYRLDPDQVIGAADAAFALGFRRIFLIAGEDPRYGFDRILSIVEALHAKRFFISLALGALAKSQYDELKSAGADEYVLKFEMSQRDVFNRLKPQTSFDERMASIGWIKESGLLLGSGSIVDYPGQTADELAEDVLLTRDLGIHWAPVIPYMPAKGTPLALEGGPGKTDRNLKVISLLRIMMPHVRITAQQPGKDVSKGLADPKGNLDALNAGADMLFADMLPDALSRNFSVVDNRITRGLEHISNMADQAGMRLVFNESETIEHLVKVECITTDSDVGSDIRKEIISALDALQPALAMAHCKTHYTERTCMPSDELQSGTVVLVNGEKLIIPAYSAVSDCVAKRILELVFDPQQ